MLTARPDSKGVENPVEKLGQGRNEMALDKGKAGGEACGESEAEAAEEVWTGGARGGGHGLEVGPCGLLHEAIAD